MSSKTTIILIATDSVLARAEENEKQRTEEVLKEYEKELQKIYPDHKIKFHTEFTDSNIKNISQKDDSTLHFIYDPKRNPNKPFEVQSGIKIGLIVGAEQVTNNQWPLIVRAGSGTDNLKTLRDAPDSGKRMIIANTPACNALETANATIATITDGKEKNPWIKEIDRIAHNPASYSNLKPFYSAEGITPNSSTKEQEESVKGKKIAIIGAGYIGTKVIKKMLELGTEVYVYSRTLSQQKNELQETPKGKLSNLYITGTIKETIKDANVVSLHVPAKAGCILTKERIATLAPNCLVINASRQNNADTNALVEAIEKREIRLAVDLDKEDLTPYLDLDEGQTTLFPHIFADAAFSARKRTMLQAFTQTCQVMFETKVTNSVIQHDLPEGYTAIDPQIPHDAYTLKEELQQKNILGTKPQNQNHYSFHDGKILSRL